MTYPFSDLREWINHLDREGELLRLKEEISLEPDVGAIAKAICEMNKRGGRAPGILAENIAGCDKKLAIGLDAAWDRTAMAFGLSKEASLKEQKEAWLKAYSRYPVKARMVGNKDAPCKENILHGSEVNLFKFPIPRLNTQDAGPYLLKTLCITNGQVQRTPAASVARHLEVRIVHDRRTQRLAAARCSTLLTFRIL